MKFVFDLGELQAMFSEYKKNNFTELCKMTH
jgi:hypothetical protein